MKALIPYNFIILLYYILADGGGHTWPIFN